MDPGLFIKFVPMDVDWLTAEDVMLVTKSHPPGSLVNKVEE